MIAILDFGAGNIKSVQKAFAFLGVPTTITYQPSELEAADAIVVPGQGALKAAMTTLKQRDLIQPLHDIIASKKPLLGICLGFQLLFDYSDEHGGHAGLGILPGHFQKFDDTHHTVPHMGWNTLTHNPSPMWTDIENDTSVYFVHSYYLPASNAPYIAATTTYNTPFVSAITKDALWATQFHPEKSSHLGLQILRNFIASLPTPT